MAATGTEVTVGIGASGSVGISAAVKAFGVFTSSCNDPYSDAGPLGIIGPPTRPESTAFEGAIMVISEAGLIPVNGG